MYNLSCICFMCLTENKNFTTLHPNDAEYKTTQQVKHLLPELTISELGIPVHICSPCHSTIQSFHEFKTKCLDNYNILKNYIKTTQGTSQDQPMKCVENNNDRLTEQEDVKEETEDPLLLLERRTNQKNLTPDNISIKEEIIESESDYSIDEDCHPFQFIKCEVSDDGQDGGPSKNIQNESVFLTDTDEFQCSICNEKFARYGYLKEHMRSAHAGVQMMPKKSAERYNNEYRLFLLWKKEYHFTDNTEDVILAYMEDMAKKMSSSSLWSKYSMVKCMLLANENVDISSFSKVTAFIKQLRVGYQANQSKALTRDEVYRFMKEAPDNEYLLAKVITIMGIGGGCRREELYNLTTNNVEDTGTQLVVTIPYTKNNQRRVFTVINEMDDINFLELYRRYLSLRPKQLPFNNLFVSYRNGKCTSQRVGIHSIGGTPRKIATYLNLENPEKYTGHCFRRTSVTFLKKYGGWKSSTLTDKYMDNSMQGQQKISQMMQGCENFVKVLQQQSTSTSIPRTTPVLKNVVQLPSEININVMPEKSRDRYDKELRDFNAWRSKKYGSMTLNETVVFSYISSLAETYKASSLWTKFSMLKKAFIVDSNVDISRFGKVMAFMKNQTITLTPKKSNVLSVADCRKFLLEASDDYLFCKVVLIFGLYGACRRNELLKLTVDDITDHGKYVLVKIQDTSRAFIIPNVNECLNPYEIYQKYAKLRPHHIEIKRFFLGYRQGKCCIQPAGTHTIGGVPRKVAEFLGLANPENYTGHCLRRSGVANMFAESCGNILPVNLIDWGKSSNVVEESVECKMEVVSDDDDVVLLV